MRISNDSAYILRHSYEKKKLLIIILKDSAYVMSYSENKYLLNTQQVARPILKNTPY